jgi:hypothetical protein
MGATTKPALRVTDSRAVFKLLGLVALMLTSMGVLLFYAMPGAVAHYAGIPWAAALALVLAFTVVYQVGSQTFAILPPRIKAGADLVLLAGTAYWSVMVAHEYWILFFIAAPMLGLKAVQRIGNEMLGKAKQESGKTSD